MHSETYPVAVGVYINESYVLDYQTLMLFRTDDEDLYGSGRLYYADGGASCEMLLSVESPAEGVELVEYL